MAANDSLTKLTELLDKESYTRTELYDVIFRVFPTYTENSCNWVIGSLIQSGILYACGKGVFARCREAWNPKFDKQVSALNEAMRKEFPLEAFAVLDSGTLNDLAGMAGGQDFLLIETSKRNLFPTYLWLREKWKNEVMITPTQRELDYYLKPGNIILKPLFSKSPCREDGCFALEKLIVDLFADRTILSLYPQVDFTESVKKIISSKNVNISTCLSYATRRGIHNEIAALLKKGCNPKTWRKIGGETR